jgi:hypothetical protein
MVIHNATQFIGLVMMCIGAGGLGHLFQCFVNPEG